MNVILDRIDSLLDVERRLETERSDLTNTFAVSFPAEPNQPLPDPLWLYRARRHQFGIFAEKFSAAEP